MSTTSTSTLTTTTTLIGVPAMTSVGAVSEKQCPTCGGNGSATYANSKEAQRRIQELEGQVQVLTERASVTAGKLADYEEEVRRLRTSQGVYDTAQNNSSLPPSSQPKSLTQRPVSPNPLSPDPPQRSNYKGLQTFTSILRGKTTTQANTSGPAPNSPLPQDKGNPENASGLQDALNREQNLRKAAESQLSQASTELEELTVQLFSQANEMVAQERKARVKLEERVAVLERRDVEKRSRLERLEKAMARVERLKALVNQ